MPIITPQMFKQGVISIKKYSHEKSMINSSLGTYDLMVTRVTTTKPNKLLSVGKTVYKTSRFYKNPEPILGPQHKPSGTGTYYVIWNLFDGVDISLIKDFDLSKNIVEVINDFHDRLLDDYCHTKEKHIRIVQNISISGTNREKIFKLLV